MVNIDLNIYSGLPPPTRGSTLFSLFRFGPKFASPAHAGIDLILLDLRRT